MADKEPQPKPQVYLESGNLEAHIIADMLRIETTLLEKVLKNKRAMVLYIVFALVLTFVFQLFY